MAGINYIPADEEKDLTLTWFYDEIPEEYRQVRKYVQVLEQEFLDFVGLVGECLIDQVITHLPVGRVQMRDQLLRLGLFAQADRDYKNKGAEHGGVIDIVAGQPIAREYPPLSRLSHDRQFTPSEQMITHCYTGLAHYHFHAQELKNSDYAGPGKGDLDTADRLDLNFLVLTFIDENQLNVDYYQHGRVVVDLGTISR